MSRFNKLGYQNFLFPNGFVKTFPENVRPRGLKVGNRRPILALVLDKVNNHTVHSSFLVSPISGKIHFMEDFQWKSEQLLNG